MAYFVTDLTSVNQDMMVLSMNKAVNNNEFVSYVCIKIK